MSTFRTIVAVDLNPLLSALPEGAHIDEITYAQGEVKIRWQNDYLETGLSVPVDFPAAQLASRTLPKGVKLTGKLAPPSAETAPVSPPLEASKQPTARGRGRRRARKEQS